MISIALAQRLRDRGLQWTPKLHDFFFIPDSDLDEHVFVISDLTIDIETLDGHVTIMFNGAVEWSLDYIFKQEAAWLPTESQLREMIGDRLVGLTRAQDGGYRCELDADGMSVVFSAEDAADAYGNALLHLLYADSPAASPYVPEAADSSGLETP